ncbi:MAG: phage tail protein [Desulfobulbus sp.]|nr:phage tail protein [Desulfobulbus sp.]
MTIQDAATLLASATEKARRLSGIVAAADDGVPRTADDLERLRASFAEREAAAVVDIGAASSALASAGNRFAAGIADASAVARSLSSVDLSVVRLDTLADQIRSDAGMIAAAIKQQAFAAIGSAMASSLADIRGVADRTQKLFEATTNPPGLPSLTPIESTAASPDRLDEGFAASIPESGGAHAHLLILTAPSGESYFFNLNTSGYDRLKRETNYSIASQERLTRRPALQAVAKGSERLSLAGVIFTQRAGAGQLEKLRAIGYRMEPLILTTGYGEALGTWYLGKIDEDQEYFFPDGMTRKQTFTLEFERYGADYQNV